MKDHLTREEKREKIQALNLTSDIFAGKVLEEPEVLEEFLNLLTGRRWHICEVSSQYSIRQVSRHSVILDLYAKEADGTRIHHELQNKNDDEHILRTRYYPIYGRYSLHKKIFCNVENRWFGTENAIGTGQQRFILICHQKTAETKYRKSYRIICDIQCQKMRVFTFPS